MILDYVQQYKGSQKRLEECCRAQAECAQGTMDALYWSGEHLEALLNMADAVVMLRTWFDRNAYTVDERRHFARAHKLPENIGIRGFGVR